MTHPEGMCHQKAKTGEKPTGCSPFTTSVKGHCQGEALSSWDGIQNSKQDNENSVKLLGGLSERWPLHLLKSLSLWSLD